MKEITNRQLAEYYDFGTIKAFKYIYNPKKKIFIKTTREYWINKLK
jgi:hypothetical protein